MWACPERSRSQPGVERGRRTRAALPPGLGRSVGPLQAHPSWESRSRQGQGGAREEGPLESLPPDSQVLGPRPTSVSFQVSDITVLLARASHTHGGLRTGRLLRLSVSVVFGLRSQNSPREKCIKKKGPTLQDAGFWRQWEDLGLWGEAGGEHGDPTSGPRGCRRAPAHGLLSRTSARC